MNVMSPMADLSPAKSEPMVWVEGGSFLMGSDRHYPEESPVHRVSVSGFYIDVYPVTNTAFRRFVEATESLNPKGGKPESSYDPHTECPNSQKNHEGRILSLRSELLSTLQAGVRMGQPIDTSTCHLGFRCIQRKETRS